jgi:hypothetical protein
MMASGKLPRNRPDIRAQLTGSFTRRSAVHEGTPERLGNKKASIIFALPGDHHQYPELMAHIHPLHS